MSENTAPTATREALLHEAVEILRPLFIEIGAELPEKIYISVGFGTGKLCSKDVKGQAWKREAAGGVNTLFVSPVVPTFAEALGVLVHQLVHVALDCDGGHGSRFNEIATRVGLEGKMLATVTGLDLTVRLMTIAADVERRLGKYDHAPLAVPAPVRRTVSADQPTGGGVAVKLHSGESSERNRWISFYCPVHSSPVRMSAKKAETNALICTEWVGRVALTVDGEDAVVVEPGKICGETMHRK